MRVGNCIVPNDFHVFEMGSGSPMPLILRRAFLTSAGVIVDMSKGRVSFANIDETFFYKVVPQNTNMHRPFCIGVTDIHLFVATS